MKRFLCFIIMVFIFTNTCLAAVSNYDQSNVNSTADKTFAMSMISSEGKDIKILIKKEDKKVTTKSIS